METIAHILSKMNDLSKFIFLFKTNVEPFTLLKSIPHEVELLVNDLELITLLEEALVAVEKLSQYLEPKLKKLNKFIRKNKSKKQGERIPYADFKIDEFPIIKVCEPEQISFEDIMSCKTVTPVKRRTEFNYEGSCPICGAPNEFIYNNNNKNQLKCKVCNNTFSLKIQPRDSSGFYCPHCKNKLVKHHDRNNYIVYACPNNQCSYRKKNEEKLGTEDEIDLLTSSKRLRLRYEYRDFKFNMDQISAACEVLDSKVDLSRIHYDQQVLGLILTYYINYGLSTRKVASILRDVHGIRISHQTIANYANAVSKIVKPLVDKYPYKLGSTLTGDETYVDIKSKQHYVFFFSDPKGKIITSYQIHEHRDTFCACVSINNCLNKYSEIPEDLTIITDGNPIYNAAQLFFEINDIKFDLIQVVGLSNKDETSKEYRPFKQIEERLNRTFKMNYYGTNGYEKLETANNYMVLYVAFFNFLRRHSALKFKTPVDDGLFQDSDLMPDKWLRLIQLSTDYLKA